MIRIYFGGAENPHWKDLLVQNGVTTMGLSYVGLSRRVKFARPWLISEHFPEDAEVFLDSGAYSVNNQEIPREEAVEISRRYMTFVSQNIEAGAWCPSSTRWSWGRTTSTRCAGISMMTWETFLPIWHSEYGLDNLQGMCATYHRVGILQADVSADISPVLNGLVKQYQVKLHGVSMTRMEAMKEIRWDSVGSTSQPLPVKIRGYHPLGAYHPYPAQVPEEIQG